MNLDVSVKGLDKAIADLEALGERASHPQEALKEIADLMEQSERDQFRLGTGWVPDAPSTLRKKARLGQPLRPMVATGALRRSLTQPSPDGVREFRDDELVFGTKLFYARFHAPKPRKGEPKRQFLVVRPRQRKAIKEIIKRFIVEGS